MSDMSAFFVKQVPRGPAQWDRTYLTFDELMKMAGCSWSKDAKPWITQDPTLVHDYRIIRQQASDGTLATSQSFFQEALMPLINKSSCFKKDMPPADTPWESVSYVVGRIRHVRAWGTVTMADGRRFPGLKERLIIPVRCYYKPTKDSNEAQHYR